MIWHWAVFAMVGFLGETIMLVITYLLLFLLSCINNLILRIMSVCGLAIFMYNKVCREGKCIKVSILAIAVCYVHHCHLLKWSNYYVDHTEHIKIITYCTHSTNIFPLINIFLY